MNHIYLEIYFYYCGLHLVLLNDMIIVSSYSLIWFEWGEVLMFFYACF